MKNKLSRSKRVASITKELTEHPNELMSLNRFSELFDVAKSTVSEDLSIVKESFDSQKLGKIETVSGAAGGVKYIPYVWDDEIEDVLDEICGLLSDPGRILPGGYLFMSDILFSPKLTMRVAKVFATLFGEKEPDAVLTVETKGIPIGLMTAGLLNVPLVVSRRDGNVTEGPLISINYVSGSSKAIQTMSLPKRALRSGSRVLVLDDFMRAGGTALGMENLVREFNSEVVGIGVLVSTAKPERKLVEDYLSLVTLVDVDEAEQKVKVHPSLVLGK